MSSQARAAAGVGSGPLRGSEREIGVGPLEEKKAIKLPWCSGDGGGGAAEKKDDDKKADKAESKEEEKSDDEGKMGSKSKKADKSDKKMKAPAPDSADPMQGGQ